MLAPSSSSQQRPSAFWPKLLALLPRGGLWDVGKALLQAPSAGFSGGRAEVCRAMTLSGVIQRFPEDSEMHRASIKVSYNILKREDVFDLQLLGHDVGADD